LSCHNGRRNGRRYVCHHDHDVLPCHTYELCVTSDKSTAICKVNHKHVRGSLHHAFQPPRFDQRHDPDHQRQRRAQC
jgi:hypothetical protein